MKLTTIALAGEMVPAALLTSGQLVDLAAAAREGLIGPAPLRELVDVLKLDGPLFNATREFVQQLEAGNTSLQDRLLAIGALHDEASATYAPLLRPSLVYACGMAYKAHMAEMGVPIPSEPNGFIKSPNAIIAHGQPVILPAWDRDMIDFECELACVIGRPLYRATPEEAIASISGYTMVNDIGSRSYVDAWHEAMQGDNPKKAYNFHKALIDGKQLPTFCPIGPVIETADTFGDPNEFSIETTLNGKIMQSSGSDDLIFPIAFSLSYFSQWYRFTPGDVYSTGTPAGVGFAHKPPRMLRDGDEVVVSCPKIGALRNPVIGE